MTTEGADPDRPERPVDRRLAEIRHQADRPGPAAVASFLHGLHDPEPRIRAASAWALGHAGVVASGAALGTALGDPELTVRIAAVEALTVMGGSESRAALESALADAADEVRCRAAWGLGHFGDERSRPPLLAALRDPEASVRRAATIALGRMAGPEMIAALEPLLDDPDTGVRRDAVHAYVRAGGRGVVERIRPLLRDPVERVRIAAAIELGALADPGAVDGLLAALAASATWERPAILHALGRIGDSRAIPSIRAYLLDRGSWTRVCALRALADLNDPELRAEAAVAAADPKPSIRGAAAEALGRRGDERDLPLLLGLLEDPHVWPRRNAIYALGRLELAAAAPRLRDELDHPEAEVRLAAIWALGYLRDDGAKDALLAVVPTLPKHPQRQRVFAEEEAAASIVSDAELCLADTLVQALARLPHAESDPLVLRTLAELWAHYSDEELDRPAMLPVPESGPGRVPPTVRRLFSDLLVAGAEDDELRPTPADVYLLPHPVGRGRGDVEEVLRVGHRLAGDGHRVRLLPYPGPRRPAWWDDPWDWPPAVRSAHPKADAPRAVTVSPNWGVSSAPARPGPWGHPGPWAPAVLEIESTYGAESVIHVSLEEFARTLTAREQEFERYREGGWPVRRIRRHLATEAGRREIENGRHLFATARGFDRPNVVHLFPTFQPVPRFRREYPAALLCGPLAPPKFARSAARAPSSPTRRSPRWFWYASPGSSSRLATALATAGASARFDLAVEVRGDPALTLPRSGAMRWRRLPLLPPGELRRHFRAADLRIVTGSRSLLEALALGRPFLYFNGITGPGRRSRRHRPEKIDALRRLWRTQGASRRVVADLGSFAQLRSVDEIVGRALTDGAWSRAFRRRPLSAGFPNPWSEAGELVRVMVHRWAAAEESASVRVRRFRAGDLRR